MAHFLHIYLINRKNNAGHRHWFGLTQAVIQAVTLRYHPFSVTSYGYNQTLWPAYSTSSIIPQKKKKQKKTAISNGGDGGNLDWVKDHAPRFYLL